MGEVEPDSRLVGGMSFRVVRIPVMVMLLVDSMRRNVRMVPEEWHVVWDGWPEYFKEMIRNSPALRKFHKEHRDWYPGARRGNEKTVVAGQGQA